MINTSQSWKNLFELKSRIAQESLAGLFKTDLHRAKHFSLNAAGLFLDYSKNLITPEIFEQLLGLTKAAQLSKKIEALFAGDNVNVTEQRPAIHPNLRLPLQQAQPEIRAAREQIQSFCKKIHASEIRGHGQKAFTDIVSIGIGGSDLGPKLVCDALRAYQKNSLKFHFISNIDDYPLTQLLGSLNPETTLFIVTSKSFGTIETLLNMQTAKTWLQQTLHAADAWKHHFIAVTANPARAREAGFNDDSIFSFWDAVGGRYSLWSSVGLSVALCIGHENFEKLLAGAHSMDQHFKNSAFNENMPVILALLEIWYCNFWNAQTHAIIPYTEKLHLLPCYLQQLVMESNGKSVDINGHKLPYGTSPIIWGEAGTNCQHSFMQLLHQSPHLIPVDFIALLNTVDSRLHHQHVLANCFSQAQVLMNGKNLKTAEDELRQAGARETDIRRLAPHKVLSGNHPSNMFLIDSLTPENLGALIALYEHKVFAAAAIWNINPFDQWGVEMGKQVANAMLRKFQNQDDCSEYDDSTRQLMSKAFEIPIHPF